MSYPLEVELQTTVSQPYLLEIKPKSSGRVVRVFKTTEPSLYHWRDSLRNTAQLPQLVSLYKMQDDTQLNLSD